MLNSEQVNAAVHHYIFTALWSEGCNGTASWADHNGNGCRGSDCDVSLLSLGFAQADVSLDSHTTMREDVAAFISGCESERPDIFDGIDPEQVGHDFWLTRNHHGAGFWDRGLGERGEWLTRMADPYGDASLWVGSDNRVHYQN